MFQNSIILKQKVSEMKLFITRTAERLRLLSQPLLRQLAICKSRRLWKAIFFGGVPGTAG